MKVVELRITGHVQGVYFRATMQEKALELGVNGWVRNTPEGTVEAHLEGEGNAVQALIDWAHRGPPGARVDDVRITDTEAQNCTVFEVQR